DNLEELMTSEIPTTDPTLTTIEPGGFLVLWADKEPEQGILHLDDVKLSGDGEQIGLTDTDGTTVLDSLTFGAQMTDISYGRVSDGGDTWGYYGAGYATMPTPGAANGTGDAPEVMLYINEFLASNDACYADPYGEFDDWIEIYNAGNIVANIGGMYLTDDPEDLTNSLIPADSLDITAIPPGEYLILWADKQPEQGVLHVEDVKLSGDGEYVALVDPDGITIIDDYTFGAQTEDISEGRMPDGGTTWQFFDVPTPGASNE
nr:lamin tail domain-containing protein [Candidatus Cloacimonadota bacterium]